MRPVPATHLGGATTANDLANGLVTWRAGLAEFVSTQGDPREIALAVVELEDLLAHALESLGELKRRVRDLNA